jgi:gamma-glutamylcyclotransferase (GGCT)/AIG2-like uncharacterized protein YtfP
MQNLFVYGTLRPEHANEHVMSDIGGEWRKASITGRWYKEGWGYENHGLRGLVVDPDGEVIHGSIFSSPDLAGHWAMLDRFEGADYERVKAVALCADGARVDVFVYALKRD